MTYFQMQWIILTFVAALCSIVLCLEFELYHFHLAFKEEVGNKSLIKLSSIGPVGSKVKFYLSTRKHEDPFIIDPQNTELLKQSPFDVNKPTKIIIHGYFGGLNRPMIKEIKQKYLDFDDVNVIAVDWSDIAWNINYYAIVNQVPDVGLYVAQLLDFLVAQGCDPQSFHLIGHSLGAHVAGYAGYSVKKGKPGRITGLDPAKPHFHNVDNSERLDSSDAIFVDCIHTCGGLLGLMEPICDVDFYPNGGKNTQPGCHYFDFGRCSHKRSHQLFAESILPSHKFPSLRCGKLPLDPYYCEETDVYMGNYVKPSVRGMYYVHTNKEFPYAVIH
uniref:Lipase n=1 Tax=Riptortus pedestris TaxID=329032 RepID=R4WNT4_RIPPE|nr:lipase [Riptortus pedestris]